MKIRTFGHFIEDGIRSMIRNRLMSSASIITVAAALFMFGIFMSLVLNVNNITSSVTSKIEVQGFLKNDYTTSQEKAAEEIIRKIEGVKDVKYISKEQALEQFKEWLGDNKSLANGLDSQNPLPPSFVVKVDSPESVASVSNELRSLNIFEKINDGRQVVDKVIKITNFIKAGSMLLIIVLAVIAISLISNTIKLTVYARKKEIGIMKYIGATDWFIRWPFVVEGIALGFVGAVVSMLVIWGAYAYVSNFVSKSLMIFSLVPTSVIMDKLTTSFLIIGISIGGIGSTLSIRKFLVK